MYVYIYMWCFCNHVKEKSCNSTSLCFRKTLSAVVHKYGRLVQEVCKTLTLYSCDVAYGLVWGRMLSCSLQPTVKNSKTWKRSLFPQRWSKPDVKPTYMARVFAADVHSFPIEIFKPAFAKKEGRTFCMRLRSRSICTDPIHWSPGPACIQGSMLVSRQALVSRRKLWFLFCFL